MKYFLILIMPFMMAFDAPSLKIGLLKYGGGGDWYANPTSLVNLSAFCNKFLNTNRSTNQIPKATFKTSTILST